MIIAVISKKGGVGKTTTSVQLAAALALEGQRVLLVDLDPNAGASLSLGLTKAELAPGVADMLLRDVPPAATVRATPTPGLWLLPASVDLRSAEIELDRLSRKDRQLDLKLQQLRPDFDYILLDCPPSMGILTRNAIVAADGYLIPATPHFLALEGLEHLVAGAERLRITAGRRACFLGIVLTTVDYRIRSTRSTVAGIRQRFGAKVFAIEIRTNISLAEAPAHGQTIFQYAPYSTGARSYRLLAEELQLGMGREVTGPRSVQVG